ncbi:pyrroline-5-carboxylate reductase [Paracoccus panacisoli]|uniref:Pyrroline-5-carboxylate reductase n=1 Tax=Paracoccus panacisoli TaxID=1510163 RepID=A0ABV6T7P1_9RHOB
MELAELNDRGLVLVGCGRMGGALLKGWLARGLAPEAVRVIDPNAPAWLAERGVATEGPLPDDPAVLVLAVKPQMMGGVLSERAAAGQGDTLVLSVAAGVTLAAYERAFPDAAIVRAMPNTPAAIGQGISAIVGNARAGAAEMALAETLMAAVGRVVRLDDEAQMDAVTAVSGSGPAYVFHLIEALAAAGAAEGLPPALALELARATVAGAGALAVAEDEDPARLREAVTSPGGTTAAGLAHLMDAADGLPPLMRRTTAAAAARGRELGA